MCPGCMADPTEGPTRAVYREPAPPAHDAGQGQILPNVNQRHIVNYKPIQNV